MVKIKLCKYCREQPCKGPGIGSRHTAEYVDVYFEVRVCRCPVCEPERNKDNK